MSIRRRPTKSGGAHFMVRIHRNGQVVATETFRRKGDAETWEREQYRALKLGEFIVPSQNTKRVADVIAEFLDSRRGQVAPHTWRTDRDNFANLPAAWGNRPISAITESDVMRHLTEELGSKAYSTVARARTSLSALFQYALREKMRHRNPVRGVPMPSGVQQGKSAHANAFTDAELIATLQRHVAIDEVMAEVTEFISLTGLRWAELRAARVRNVQDVPYPRLEVSRAQSDGYPEKSTKNGKPRYVPLTTRAYEIARDRITERGPSEHLFITSTGRQLSGNGFRKRVKWTSTSCGHTIHDLRHYAASCWLRAGIPIHQVAEWLGDDPRTVLKVYAHVLGEGQNIAALQHLNSFGPLDKYWTFPVRTHESQEKEADAQQDENGA